MGTDYNERFYFVSSGPTCICSGGNTTGNNLVVYSSSAIGCYNNNLVIQNNGNTQIRGSLLISGKIVQHYIVHYMYQELQF